MSYKREPIENRLGESASMQSQTGQQEVKVKGIVFKSGSTKIAVPITGDTTEKIIQEAHAAVAVKPDVIEWRIDFYRDVFNPSDYLATVNALRKILGKIVLLTTFRTSSEGGHRSRKDDQKYFSLISRILRGRLTDVVDIELNRDQYQVAHLVQLAHDQRIAVIMSNHEFEQTPPEVEIRSRLEKMKRAGADIAKIAVMPQTPADVLTLLNATYKAHQRLKLPLITMAMGDLGKVTRISGSIFGSVLSFAAVGNALAPGQLSVSELRADLESLKF